MSRLVVPSTIVAAFLVSYSPGQAGATVVRYSISQDVPPPVRIRPRPETGYRGPVSPEMVRFPLATTMWMEARNQPVSGQLAVAFVIKNRVAADKKRWGHGLLGVVTKYKQFSCHNYFHGRIDTNRKAFFAMLRQPENSRAKRQWRQIQRRAKAVWLGQVKDPSHGATFYATVSSNPYWRYDMTVVGQIGDHVMFRPQTAAEHKAYLRDMKANRQLAKARRIARKANAKHKAVMVIKHRAVIHGGRHG